MDTNHRFSRMTSGWISPQFKVIYSASATSSDPGLESVFDAPKGMIDRFAGPRDSLANQADRMKFVAEITKRFNYLMENRREYMKGELHKILAWTAA